MSYVDKSLNELSKKVFSKKYQYIGEPQIFKGNSGKTWKFDALVKDQELGQYGVFIRDWKREISITQLRQLHKACIDIPELNGGIMICNIISDFSREFCNQYGLQLLSKGHLISKLKSQQLF
ncbi:MAG: hypothetical protein ACTSR8_01160 [Promethearchaeota archaeon]